eukprot:TRINITY_DN2157_c0_g3_i2.p1 TRINITY_DN2157_c0_g3~~TRINITY_DN2157_c0_g3_i2.p1  ORF type:complete len:554 (+),score=80.14 TRINITY_DN2157_c0_g3_i2:169-1662(+)
MNNGVDISYHCDGLRLYVAHNSGFVSVFSLPTMKRVACIPHRDAINYLSCSPNNQSLLSIGDEHSIFVYEIDEQAYHESQLSTAHAGEDPASTSSTLTPTGPATTINTIPTPTVPAVTAPVPVHTIAAERRTTSPFFNTLQRLFGLGEADDSESEVNEDNDDDDDAADSDYERVDDDDDDEDHEESEDTVVHFPQLNARTTATAMPGWRVTLRQLALLRNRLTRLDEQVSSRAMKPHGTEPYRLAAQLGFCGRSVIVPPGKTVNKSEVREIVVQDLAQYGDRGDPQYCDWSADSSIFAVSTEQNLVVWWDAHTLTKMGEIKCQRPALKLQFAKKESNIFAFVERSCVHIVDPYNKNQHQIIDLEAMQQKIDQQKQKKSKLSNSSTPTATTNFVTLNRDEEDDENKPWYITGLCFSEDATKLFVGSRRGILEFSSVAVLSLLDLTCNFIRRKIASNSWPDTDWSCLPIDVVDRIFTRSLRASQNGSPAYSTSTIQFKG